MDVAGPSQPTTLTAYRHDQASLNYDQVASSVCGGCNKTIDAETGGVVVAFGSSLWHTDCFRCAKCGDQVNADSTLLLLGDGHPICSNCSYVCNVCHLQIQDEAIMAGQDAFHAACFTCKTCHKRIEESVFAKASHGIYCMDCHNDRVARTRRHAERRQAKFRSPRPKTGGSREPSSRTPPSLPRESPRSNSVPQPQALSPDPLNGTSHPDPHLAVDDTYSFSVSQPSPQQVPQDVDPGQDVLDQTILITQPPPQLHYPANETPLHSSPADIDNDTMSFADMQDSVILLHSTHDQLPTAERASMLSVPLLTESGERRRKHYDEGVRPLQAFFGKQQQQTLLSAGNQSSLSIPSGLDVPGRTSKSEKRRSINPIYLPSVSNQSSVNASHPGRSASPDSMHTAYYSPAVSPHDGRSSPLQEAQNRSRSPSLLANHSYSVPHLANGDEEYIEAPSSSQSFPPRGRSLPSNQPLSKTASSASTSTIRPLPKIEPSISIQAPSSDSHTRSLLSPDPPRPPPKDLAEEPPCSPSSPAFSDNSESASQKPHLLEAPALPPMRFSTGPERFKDFAADILKVVSDSEPRVPRPRDSGVLTKPVTESPDGVEPPSPSQEAVKRITSPITESKSTPALTHQYSDSSGGSEDSLRMRKGSDASIPNSISQPSTPTQPRSRRHHQPQSHSQGTPIAPHPPRKSSSASDHRNGGVLGEGYNSFTNESVTSLVPSLRPSTLRNDSGDLAARRLREALNDATARNAKSVKLDPELAEAVLKAMDGSKEMYSGLKGDMDQIKRTSHQYMTGFSVAQEEYQKEVAARKDLQAEVTRLRVQLSGQAARLTAMSAEQRTRASMEKLAVELGTQIISLEHEIAKLRVDRDMVLAEIEELVTTKKNVPHSSSAELTSNISRALSTRLDYVKSQYRKELEPLQEKRERLFKEVTELREARDIFLEETTALNSRNEQLADLNAQIASQIQNTMAEAGVHPGSTPQLTADVSTLSIFSESASLKSSMRGKKGYQRSGYSPSVISFNTTTSTTLEASEESTRFGKVGKTDIPEAPASKKFKWFRDGVMTVGKTPPPALPHPEKVKGHSFISANVLRIVRCDQCGDKLWGAQLRCTNCHFVCHTRCGALVKGPCKHSHIREENSTEIVPLAPSMFGRDLIEQVRSDAQGGSRDIPIIVEKCIEAVEAIGLDYEGIYRKTGGSSQSKAITQLFERGQYETFDLLDTDVFNDISSVTSVLKNYFRALPNPLLTFDLHEQFVNATGIKDPRDKLAALSELVHQLPQEHYCTLRALMIHLNRIRVRSDENLMTARNLGVVFGPTLMRSRDASQEFADMAGKALSVEFLVDNAPIVFQDPHL